MPNTKSAIKQLRQDEVRRLRNKSIKSRCKTEIKKVLAAVDSGDIETAEAQYRVAAKRLDKAGSAKVLHPNTAARQKSRLQRLIKAAKKAS